jgi:hypothetical protein
LTLHLAGYWSPKPISASFPRGLEKKSVKRVSLVLGITDVESSAHDYSQRLGCRPDLPIPGKYVLWRSDAVNLSIRKVGHKRVGLAGGMGRAMWLGVEILSSSDYLDGVLGRLSLPVLRASESICFRALS